ncbi:hypothetical protein Tco_0262039 [Tanacetum coccineum]
MTTSSSKGASRSQQKSSSKYAQAEEHGSRDDDLEEPSHQEFNTGNDDVSPAREAHNPCLMSFLATLIDFTAFTMNRLKINILTQDVLTGTTYNLMKGTCKSVVELEYHLEEEFKATNDQLDWYNPKGRSYPHDLSKPLPLIQNAQGRQVIPFDHFINNDLEYLKRQSLSQRYTTSIIKTKASEYHHVKWIKDKVPRSIIYQDEMDINHLMCIDELYKFSDDTLNHVRTALNDIATGIQMEYLPKRRWTKQDKQRARVMINVIDKKLRDRRLMRSLEKFVGGKPYRGDLWLL